MMSKLTLIKRSWRRNALQGGYRKLTDKRLMLLMLPSVFCSLGVGEMLKANKLLGMRWYIVQKVIYSS